MSIEPISWVASGVGVGIIAATVNLLHDKLFTKQRSRMEKELEPADRRYTEHEPKDDILRLMNRNVAELKKNYVINKRQANKAFTSALVICFMGFILFVAGVIIAFFYKQHSHIVVYTTIAGVIIELISGLFFWLYAQSLKQINVFNQSLMNTEKSLTAIQLAGNVSEKNRDLIYGYIIQSIFKNQKYISPINSLLSGNDFNSYRELERS